MIIMCVYIYIVHAPHKYTHTKKKRCSTSPPGGNQVDGLPPAASDLALAHARRVIRNTRPLGPARLRTHLEICKKFFEKVEFLCN